MEIALGDEISLVKEAMFVVTNAIYSADEKVLQRIL
jgi:hypothetical protein